MSWAEHNGDSRNGRVAAQVNDEAGLYMSDIREGETRIGSGGFIHTSRNSLFGGPSLFR